MVDELTKVGKAAKRIQQALDELPCKTDDTQCNSDICDYYEVCYKLVEVRDDLEWRLLTEEITEE